MTAKQKSIAFPALIAIVAAVAITASWKFAGNNNTDPGTEPTPDPALATALLRAGLSPEAMACSGMDAAEASAVASAFATATASSEISLEELDLAYEQARFAHDKLQRKVRNGLASDEELGAFQTAKAELAAATEARDAYFATLFDAAVNGCASDTVTCLRNLSTNKSWGLPSQYCTVERTQQEWVDLRDALANERISAKYEEEPDAEAQALLHTCNAEDAVVAAKVGLDTNAAAVEAAWELAISD